MLRRRRQCMDSWDNPSDRKQRIPVVFSFLCATRRVAGSEGD